jgi:hypothetical protein
LRPGRDIFFGAGLLFKFFGVGSKKSSQSGSDEAKTLLLTKKKNIKIIILKNIINFIL